MSRITEQITTKNCAQGDVASAALRGSILKITNRRKHERLVRSFPFWLVDSSGRTISQFCTDDVSNAGCRGTSASAPVLETNQIVQIELKIPRHTENTYMLETVKVGARVVRFEQTLAYSSDSLTIALEFTSPLELDID